MMEALVVDPVGGLSGDMFLGAIMDLGVSPERLEAVYRDGIGFSVKVSVDKSCLGLRVSFEGYRFRKLSPEEMIGIIESGNLREKTKEILALKTLVDAEGRLHGGDVHFHDLGSPDTLFDIVGTFEGLAILGLNLESVFSLPVPVNFGDPIVCGHGPIPNPPPASLEILKGFPVKPCRGPENVTPTGASILKALKPKFDLPALFKVESQGIGAGKRVFKDRPNILRLLVVDTFFPANDRVYLVETNIDDMNPEVFPHVMDLLMSRGALDVCLLNVISKKGRPGFLLRILAGGDALKDVVETVFSETSTIGVRVSEESRVVLHREEVSRDVEGESVRSKKVERPFGYTEKVEVSDLEKLSFRLKSPLWILRKKF